MWSVWSVVRNSSELSIAAAFVMFFVRSNDQDSISSPIPDPWYQCDPWLRADVAYELEQGGRVITKHLDLAISNSILILGSSRVMLHVNIVLGP